MGHTGWVNSIAYSPGGQYIISGSHNHTIRIWDAESGAAIGQPLEGHAGLVYSVAYSPDGWYIISGSDNETIRIWDAMRVVAVNKPLDRHSSSVNSVAYSPDGQQITSGSSNQTLQVWNGETAAPFGEPHDGHTNLVVDIAFLSDRQHTISGSNDNTTHLCNAFRSVSTQSSSCNPMCADLYTKPDQDGWVRDSEGGLLYWVPQECHRGLHSPACLTIPLTSRYQSVSLDFDNFAFGTSWTQIFESAAS